MEFEGAELEWVCLGVYWYCTTYKARFIPNTPTVPVLQLPKIWVIKYSFIQISCVYLYFFGMKKANSWFRPKTDTNSATSFSFARRFPAATDWGIPSSKFKIHPLSSMFYIYLEINAWGISSQKSWLPSGAYRNYSFNTHQALNTRISRVSLHSAVNKEVPGRIPVPPKVLGGDGII